MKKIVKISVLLVLLICVINNLCQKNIKNDNIMYQYKYEEVFVNNKKMYLKIGQSNIDFYNLTSIKIKFSKSYILILLLILTFLIDITENKE